MSYSFVFPAVCIKAISALLPEGWSEKDGEKKLCNVMSAAFRAIEFGEKASKTAKRLKFQAKKQTASYSTSMEGSTKTVQQRPIDLYNWLWDIAELEQVWATKDLPAIAEVNIPAHVADWIETVFAAKNAPKVSEPEAETEEVETEEVEA